MVQEKKASRFVKSTVKHQYWHILNITSVKNWNTLFQDAEKPILESGYAQTYCFSQLILKPDSPKTQVTGETMINSMHYLYKSLRFKPTHLVIGEWWWEVMSVQIFPSVNVGKSYGLPTFHWCPTLAAAVTLPTDPPVAVGIIWSFNSCHWLLPTSCLNRIKWHKTYPASPVQRDTTNLQKFALMLSRLHVYEMLHSHSPSTDCKRNSGTKQSFRRK